MLLIDIERPPEREKLLPFKHFLILPKQSRQLTYGSQVGDATLKRFMITVLRSFVGNSGSKFTPYIGAWIGIMEVELMTLAIPKYLLATLKRQCILMATKSWSQL